MTNLTHRLMAAVLALVAGGAVDAQIASEELTAPKFQISGNDLIFSVQPSVYGRTYQLQWSETMATGTWQDLEALRTGDGNNLDITTAYLSWIPRRFFRLELGQVSPLPAPDGFAQIPAGSFVMGDQSSPLVGGSNELPVHSVQVSSFYIAKYLVTKADWDAVRSWGQLHGYTFSSSYPGLGKAADHPVQSVMWYDMVKWCNARSEKDGLTPCYFTDATQIMVFRSGSTNITNTMVKWSANGYRLPTEAEWEKAARGGPSGRNFPWGNTITHSQANYNSSASYSYDVSPTRGPNPIYGQATSPVGSFPANGYGLFDMAGNVYERCWDCNGTYSAAPQTDPHGPDSGTLRVLRGGAWSLSAPSCRVSARSADSFDSFTAVYGFRVARTVVP